MQQNLYYMVYIGHKCIFPDWILALLRKTLIPMQALLKNKTNLFCIDYPNSGGKTRHLIWVVVKQKVMSEK